MVEAIPAELAVWLRQGLVASKAKPLMMTGRAKRNARSERVLSMRATDVDVLHVSSPDIETPRADELAAVRGRV